MAWYSFIGEPGAKLAAGFDRLPQSIQNFIAWQRGQDLVDSEASDVFHWLDDKEEAIKQAQRNEVTARHARAQFHYPLTNSVFFSLSLLLYLYAASKTDDYAIAKTAAEPYLQKTGICVNHSSTAATLACELAIKQFISISIGWFARVAAENFTALQCVLIPLMTLFAARLLLAYAHYNRVSTGERELTERESRRYVTGRSVSSNDGYLPYFVADEFESSEMYDDDPFAGVDDAFDRFLDDEQKDDRRADGIQILTHKQYQASRTFAERVNGFGKGVKSCCWHLWLCCQPTQPSRGPGTLDQLYTGLKAKYPMVIGLNQGVELRQRLLIPLGNKLFNVTGDYEYHNSKFMDNANYHIQLLRLAIRFAGNYNHANPGNYDKLPTYIVNQLKAKLNVAVLTFENINEYLKNPASFSAAVRIPRGRTVKPGMKRQLDISDSPPSTPPPPVPVRPVTHYCLDAPSGSSRNESKNISEL